jgi:hypothetical protein
MRFLYRLLSTAFHVPVLEISALESNIHLSENSSEVTCKEVLLSLVINVIMTGFNASVVCNYIGSLLN